MSADRFPLPAPGVYFGMPEAEYHAAPALSNSGIKKLMSSPMNFWASQPWLNPEAEPVESEFLELGKAYHARITEGREVFYSRYAPALDPSAHPEALRSAEELRAAVDAFNEGRPKAEQIKKSGSKSELAARLVAADPAHIIWDDLLSEHAAHNEGKALLPQSQLARIEIAAAMIERHPQLCKAFTGGYAEVSIFWTCPEYGIPMKARLDYLKNRAIVDLKTFGNAREKSIDSAIAYAVAERKYHYQVAVYQEAVTEAKALVRTGAVHGEVAADWLQSFVKAQEPEFLFVFQQTGPAPIARGKVFGRNLTFDIAKIAVREAKRRFFEARQTYGADPWLDIAEIGTFDDSEFPAFIADQ